GPSPNAGPNAAETRRPEERGQSVPSVTAGSRRGRANVAQSTAEDGPSGGAACVASNRDGATRTAVDAGRIDDPHAPTRPTKHISHVARTERIRSVGSMCETLGVYRRHVLRSGGHARPLPRADGSQAVGSSFSAAE